MTRTAQRKDSLTRQEIAHIGRQLRPLRFAARLAVVCCAWLIASSAALGQNVQFTQGSVGSGLDNTIQIPITSYPGRGATSLPVTLYYSSQVWRVAYKKTVRADGNGLRNSVTEAVYAERSAAGWTTSLDVPQLEWPKADDYYWYNGKPTHSVAAGYDYKVANLFIHMPDGSTHELRKADEVYAVSGPGVDMAGGFYAVDGSRMRFDGAGDGTGTLYLSDGSRYEFKEGGDVKFIDRHGNTLRYDGANRRWTDTLGTTLRGYVRTPWPASPQAGEDYSYQPPGFSSAYIFKWRHLSDVLTPAEPGQQAPQIRPASDYYLPSPGSDTTDWNEGNFPQAVPETGPAPLFHSAALDDTSLASFTYVVGRGQGSGDLFNPAVLAEIVLPNGLSYKFTYDEYGELDKVVYPTGGYERLKYGSIPAVGGTQAPYSEASRGVKSRRVGPMATVTGEDAVWTYETAASDLPDSLLVKTTAPDGTYTESYRHSFYDPAGNFGYQDARNGLTFDERVYTKDPTLGGVMLRRTLTEWAQSSFSYTGPKPASNLQAITYHAYRNARPTKTVSLMLDTGGAALAKQISYTYGASDPAESALVEKTTGLDLTGGTESLFAEIDQATAKTGSVSTILGYTFPAAGSTETAYLNDEAYRARNILGLVASVVLKNAAGQPVSKTEMFYDEADVYPLITYEDLGDSYTDTPSNARGNPTTVRRYVNAATAVASGAECQSGVCLQTHAQFDQCGNLINFWDERGVQSQKAYSSDYRHAYLTKTTSAVPDPNGEHGSDQAFTSFTTYEAATGLVLSTKDANDQETKFSYNIDPTHRDPLNRLRKVTRPDDSWTKTDYNDVAGNLYVHTETQFDTSRSTQGYEFIDKMGRVSHSLMSEGVGGYIAIDTEYDRQGRVLRMSNPYRTQMLGGASGGTRWTTSEYDPLGRVSKVTLPDDTYVTKEYRGVYTTVTTQGGKKRRQKVDALGRLVRVDEPGAGGSLGSFDFPVQPSFFEYDTLGNVVRISQGLKQQGANPEDDDSYLQHRFFKYDALSRLTHEKQAEQAGTISTAPDRLTGNASWSRQLIYDETRDGIPYRGRLTTLEDARHVFTYFHYDQLGRTYQVGYSDGTPSVKSKYDQARTDAPPTGEQTVIFKNKGMLTEVTTDAATTAEGWMIPQTQQLYDYDLMGRVRRQRHGVGANSYELRYAYNLGGGLVSERYPSGRVVAYSYDDAGRILSAGSGSTAYASAMSYMPFGGLESMTLGNGTVYSMTYSDTRLQLASITLTQASNTLQKYEYKYGSVNMATGAVDESRNDGQIACIESTVGAQKLWQQRFAYDSLGRLVEAGEYNSDTERQSYYLKYGYDAFGNRFQRLLDNPHDQNSSTNPFPQFWVEDGVYDVTTNRFNSGQGVVYDNAGNVTTDSRFRQRKFQYDANNRQQRSSNLDDSGAVQSVYNGVGQRVATVDVSSGAITRLMVYDVGGDLVAEYGGAVVANGTQYVMSDHQRSTRLTMYSAQVNNQLVAVRQDYLPFGEEVPGTVGARAGVIGYGQATAPRQKYAGMEGDEATRMSHTQWREYDNMSARWTAPDPYGGSISFTSPQTFNRFTYCNNDPVNLTDPAGLMPASEGWGSAAANFWGGDPGFFDPHFGGPAEIGEALIRLAPPPGKKKHKIPKQGDVPAPNPQVNPFTPAPGSVIAALTQKSDGDGEPEIDWPPLEEMGPPIKIYTVWINKLDMLAAFNREFYNQQCREGVQRDYTGGLTQSPNIPFMGGLNPKFHPFSWNNPNLPNRWPAPPPTLRPMEPPPIPDGFKEKIELGPGGVERNIVPDEKHFNTNSPGSTWRYRIRWLLQLFNEPPSTAPVPIIITFPGWQCYASRGAACSGGAYGPA